MAGTITKLLGLGVGSAIAAASAPETIPMAAGGALLSGLAAAMNWPTASRESHEDDHRSWVWFMILLTTILVLIISDHDKRLFVWIFAFALLAMIGRMWRLNRSDKTQP